MSRKLVAYFSASGVTATVAQTLADAVGADIFEIAPTIINTFLESYDLTGKTIIPFATSGGSGMGKTNEKLAPSCKGAKLLEGRVLNPHASIKELTEWAESIQI